MYTSNDVVVTFDGEYPIRCYGKLVVTVGTLAPVEFAERSLRPPGMYYDSSIDSNFVYSDGPWGINEDMWPKELEQYKDIVLEAIKRDITGSCCSGCE